MVYVNRKLSFRYVLLIYMTVITRECFYFAIRFYLLRNKILKTKKCYRSKIAVAFLMVNYTIFLLNETVNIPSPLKININTQNIRSL